MISRAAIRVREGRFGRNRAHWAQQIEAAVARQQTGQDTFVGGFDRVVDQLRACGVADFAALPAGQARADQQMQLTAPYPAEMSTAGVQFGRCNSTRR